MDRGWFITQTILVMAGYGRLARWVCRCLVIDGHLPATAKDPHDALRMALLLKIDLIVAWPAISGCESEEVLAVVDTYLGGDEIPVLFAAFQRPSRLRSVDDWIKVPVVADDLRRKVRCLLDRAPPRELELPTSCPSLERSNVPITAGVAKPRTGEHPVGTLRQAALLGVRRRCRLGRHGGW
jgi:hypothetical protein